MKIQTILALPFCLVMLAGCSDESSKFKGQFLAGCMDSGSSESYCSCALAKMEVQYSPTELSAMNDKGIFPKNFPKVINAIREVCQL